MITSWLTNSSLPKRSSRGTGWMKENEIYTTGQRVPSTCFPCVSVVKKNIKIFLVPYHTDNISPVPFRQLSHRISCIHASSDDQWVQTTFRSKYDRPICLNFSFSFSLPLTFGRGILIFHDFVLEPLHLKFYLFCIFLKHVVLNKTSGTADGKKELTRLSSEVSDF